MDGLLAIDKPAGVTSHDVVARVRRATGWTRVGHTGTLDPMATGVLALVVGRATRLAQFLGDGTKEYEAEIRLGFATDTYDATGQPMDAGSEAPCAWPPIDQLRPVLEGLLGTRAQAPPAFSAKKVEGVRAYALARKGRTVVPNPAVVTLHAVQVIDMAGDRLRTRLCCSGGFYVRSFAHELGLAVGPGAHLSALVRTVSGRVRLADSLTLDAVEADPGLATARLVPMAAMLGHLPAVVVNEAGVRRAQHGNDLRPTDCLSQAPSGAVRIRVLDERGALLAVAEPGKLPGVLRPAVVVV